MTHLRSDVFHGFVWRYAVTGKAWVGVLLIIRSGLVRTPRTPVRHTR